MSALELIILVFVIVVGTFYVINYTDYEFPIIEKIAEGIKETVDEAE